MKIFTKQSFMRGLLSFALLLATAWQAQEAMADVYLFGDFSNVGGNSTWNGGKDNYQMLQNATYKNVYYYELSVNTVSTTTNEGNVFFRIKDGSSEYGPQDSDSDMAINTGDVNEGVSGRSKAFKFKPIANTKYTFIYNSSTHKVTVRTSSNNVYLYGGFGSGNNSWETPTNGASMTLNGGVYSYTWTAESEEKYFNLLDVSTYVYPGNNNNNGYTGSNNVYSLSTTNLSPSNNACKIITTSGTAYTLTYDPTSTTLYKIEGSSSTTGGETTTSTGDGYTYYLVVGDMENSNAQKKFELTRNSDGTASVSINVSALPSYYRTYNGSSVLKFRFATSRNENVHIIADGGQRDIEKGKTYSNGDRSASPKNSGEEGYTTNYFYLKTSEYTAEDYITFTIKKKGNTTNAYDFEDIYFISAFGYGQDVTLTVTLDNTYLRTYSTTNNRALPEGLKAYVAHGFTKDETVSATHDGTVALYQVNYIPANCGVLLVGSSSSYTLPLYTGTVCGSDSTALWKNTHTGDTWKNYLVGSYYNKIIAGLGKTDKEGNYTSRNFGLALFSDCDSNKGKTVSDDYVGFFRFTSTGFVGTNKAYLCLPSTVMGYSGQHLGNGYDDATSARNCALWFDDVDEEPSTTAIAAPGALVAQQAEEQWFTLQGVAIDQPTTPGLYVKGNRKVLVK